MKKKEEGHAKTRRNKKPCAKHEEKTKRRLKRVHVEACPSISKPFLGSLESATALGLL